MDIIKIIFILLAGIFIGYHNSYRTIILNCPKTMEKIIKKLIKQTARWSTAAAQDKSPLISVLHANYGMGYLMALKSIASQEQINKVSKINMQKFETEITNQQDKSTLFAAKNCPNFTKHLNTYLARIAKEKD